MDVFELIGGEVSDVTLDDDDTEGDSGSEEDDDDKLASAVASGSPDAAAELSDFEEDTDPVAVAAAHAEFQRTVAEWKRRAHELNEHYHKVVQNQTLPQYVEQMRRLFLEHVPVIQLSRHWRSIPDWSGDAVLSRIATEVFLNSSKAKLGRLAPPEAYCTATINRLVKDLEDVGRLDYPDELCDALAANLLRRQNAESATSGDKAAPIISDALSYRHLFFHDTTVVLRCSRAIGIGFGTGSEVWKSGKIFSDMVARYPSLLNGRSVLEVGSGTGILGLSLALSMKHTDKRFALKRLCLTDFLGPVLLNMRHNVLVNGLDLLPDDVENVGASSGPLAVEVKKLDWGRSDGFRLYDFDTIIGSDLIADPLAATLLCALLHKFLRRKRCKSGREPEVFLTIQRRQEATLQKFFDDAEQAGLILDVLQEFEGHVLLLNVTAARSPAEASSGPTQP